MSDRAFPEVAIAVADKSVKALQIACSGCGAVAYFLHQTGHQRKPPIAAIQHFQNKHWSVGNRPTKDFCPECARRAKRKPEVKMTEQIKISAAEPPREMSREERRIINDKLDEVYGKEAYRPPWTDSAVARDLGVPRDWVSQVREQFFGAAGSNPAFDEYLTLHSAMRRECDEYLAAEGELRARYDVDMLALGKRMSGLAKMMEDLHRIGKRIEREIGK